MILWTIGPDPFWSNPPHHRKQIRSKLFSTENPSEVLLGKTVNEKTSKLRVSVLELLLPPAARKAEKNEAVPEEKTKAAPAGE